MKRLFMKVTCSILQDKVVYILRVYFSDKLLGIFVKNFPEMHGSAEI